MTIRQFYSEENNKITFTRQQASDFAKTIADDFNPLHDVKAKRFCVPGDLLFSIVLTKYGLSEHMRFTFSGMVTDDVTLSFPEGSPRLVITGENNKDYLSIDRDGKTSKNTLLIDTMINNYVAFSGQTFPHILIPLLKSKDCMINPKRPMVMYQSMSIDLLRLDLNDISLEFDEEKTTVETEGKRANICLAFKLRCDNEVIGHGEKHMLVSGLLPFDENAIAGITADYSQWKKNYKST